MNPLPTLNPKTETAKIVAFIQSVFQKTGKTKGIVAVSGGIDSASSLILAAKALKPENVLALHLPSRRTAPIHTQHAILAMDAAQIPTHNRITINIGAIIQKSWRIINNDPVGANPRVRPNINTPLEGQTQGSAPTPIINRLRLANLSARIRMMLLYDQAKKHDALVIGTENLSEHLLGYFTRFGDEASDLEPIRHLYKTQVFDLAKSIGVPQPIIEKKPSADLWPGQTDAKELGFAYKEADPILYLYTQEKTREQIIDAGFKDTLVDAVLETVSGNQFKLKVPYLI